MPTKLQNSSVKQQLNPRVDQNSIIFLNGFRQGYDRGFREAIDLMNKTQSDCYSIYSKAYYNTIQKQNTASSPRISIPQESFKRIETPKSQIQFSSRNKKVSQPAKQAQESIYARIKLNDFFKNYHKNDAKIANFSILQNSEKELNQKTFSKESIRKKLEEKIRQKHKDRIQEIIQNRNLNQQIQKTTDLEYSQLDQCSHNGQNSFSYEEKSHQLKEQYSLFSNHPLDTEIQPQMELQSILKKQKPNAFFHFKQQEELFSNLSSDEKLDVTGFGQFDDKIQIAPNQLNPNQSSMPCINQSQNCLIVNEESKTKKSKALRRFCTRRKPFTTGEIDALRQDFQKLIKIQKLDPEKPFSQIMGLIQKKYTAGRTTIHKMYSDYQKDPSLKKHYTKRSIAGPKPGEALKIQQRIQAVQTALVQNPFLTNMGITQSIDQILKSQNNQLGQKFISYRITRDYVKKAGFLKRRFRSIAASRNSSENINLRLRFCQRIDYYIKSSIPIFFINVDEMALHPYLSKDLAWAKCNQNQNQLLSKQFRRNYFNGLFIAGLKFLEWEITEGFWSNDKYVEVLTSLVGRISSQADFQAGPDCKVIIIVNPIYIENVGSETWSIDKQSEKKMSVLEKICSRMSDRISVEKVSPFSSQLDMIFQIEVFLREREIHKEIFNKNFEGNSSSNKQKLWLKIIQHLDKLKDSDFNEYQKLWAKFNQFIVDGLNKVAF